MTKEECLKNLKCELELLENHLYTVKVDNESEMIEEYKITIEALEKQIPKKPTDVCTPVVKWGLCPVCKGELNKLGGRKNQVFASDKYCPDCGQALDWSDSK